MEDFKDKIFICPMHSEVVSDMPGLCSECGMKLIETKSEKRKEQKKEREHGSHDGHDKFSADNVPADKHAGHSTNIFKFKFWVSFVLSIPVVLYSDITTTLTGYQAPVFLGSFYLPFVLASVIFFFGGWVFIASAYRELKAKLPGMMTLVALAISVAYIYSVFVIFFGGGDTLFWELATLIMIMLLGHWMEMRAVSGAQGALKELSKLLPDKVEVIRNGVAYIIPLIELAEGDIVLVKPGGRIPADGIVEKGMSDVNESIVTGESKPVSKKEGSQVIAGTTNGDGSLRIKVLKIGKKTFLAGVMRLVAEAQSSKSRLQMLSDRAAFFLTIIAVVAGGVTLGVWLIFSDSAFAVNRMVAVLVITCPHALGLAIPLVASISTTKAARNGFLVRERLALEAARTIDIVLFDKTGTLTEGKFGVEAVLNISAKDNAEVLRYAASVNSNSEHPLAQAIMEEAKKRNAVLFEADNFQRIPGKGVRADIDGIKIIVGSMSLAEEQHIAIPKDAEVKINAWAREGKTINAVIKNGVFLGVIVLSDMIRGESRKAIASLHAMGVATAMITGDAEDVAKEVARKLGIDTYFARVLPGEKAEIVKKLQAGVVTLAYNFKLAKKKSGSRLIVGMVGDGVNDAPALMQADLGIAIGAGTNVAIESAGIILVRNDPRDIPKIIRLSKLTYTKMLQNLFWATGYNVVAIPLAAGVLAFKGIFLQPAFAAILMSLSTVIVAINAMLLRGKKL